MQTKDQSIRSTGARNSLQIVLLSDTHEQHREVDVPSGDILIHSGDLTMFSRSLRAIHDFNQWLGELPHPWKIVVPGNHEIFLQINPANRSAISNATVLIGEGVTMAGLRFWGSPVTPVGPAFGILSPQERRKQFAAIPDDVDILVTHGPPRGILDRTHGSEAPQGDSELLAAVMRVRPKLHVFGHIHGGYGIFETDQTIFVNAALLGAAGDIDKAPVVLRIDRK